MRSQKKISASLRIWINHWFFDLVGLTDKGITNVGDIRGKKIGIPMGTINEFYLGRFLELNGMSLSDGTLVYQSPGQAVDAMTDGSVDAVVPVTPTKVKFGSNIQMES